MSKPKQEWVMPEWMKQYRELIESGCGGQSAEELMNREGVNFFNNPLLCELIGMCAAKISLLEKLKEKGLLKEIKSCLICKRPINEHSPEELNDCYVLAEAGID